MLCREKGEGLLGHASQDGLRAAKKGYDEDLNLTPKPLESSTSSEEGQHKAARISGKDCQHDWYTDRNEKARCAGQSLASTKACA